jgi:Na+-transporting methylmalonyl-CoA/oxaloacetate decarboxylase gamma subunit
MSLNMTVGLIVVVLFILIAVTGFISRRRRGK